MHAGVTGSTLDKGSHVVSAVGAWLKLTYISLMFHLHPGLQHRQFIADTNSEKAFH